jgi:hypothetical protein
MKNPRGDRTNEQFQRKFHNISSRVNEICHKHQAQGYIMIIQNKRIHLFDSHTGQRWQPSPEEIVSWYSLSHRSRY